MADVDQDDRVMKRRLNVRAESELQMHQGSLVDLTELINATYWITLQRVSLLISTLIRNADSFFIRVPFMFSSLSVQSVTLLRRVLKQNPHVRAS